MKTCLQVFADFVQNLQHQCLRQLNIEYNKEPKKPVLFFGKNKTFFFHNSKTDEIDNRFIVEINMNNVELSLDDNKEYKIEFTYLRQNRKEVKQYNLFKPQTK